MSDEAVVYLSLDDLLEIAAELVLPLAATASGPRATDQRGWSSFEEQFISGK